MPSDSTMATTNAAERATGSVTGPSCQLSPA
jgi:hypothetical protein